MSRSALDAPQLWVDRRAGVLEVHGEIDIATDELFDAELRAAVVDGNSSGEVHVDFADVTFIDVAGCRVLVVAAGQMGRRRQLVVLRPPRVCARVLDIGWGHVPGLRLENLRTF